ncbi:hypothetical protein L1049_015280 [Liquidambar formosana]|uniref:Uncharacterized protein n=1 Tax=Liquidambar formosana TaxID=63359 RepID=A0AAP0RYM1_LIQFO
MKIQILSRKFIKPSSPTPHHLKKMKLSFIDQIAPSVYPPFIFYYPADGSSRCRAENIERRDRLEKSLSDTLRLYYPLAGRFIKDDLLIDCNDHGVEYLEVQVHGQLVQLLHGEPKIELLSPLVPFAAESDTSPLVVIQINVFDCGGLVIGMRASHRIVDAFTYATFVNGWAAASRVGINQVIGPSFGIASFLPERDVSWVKSLKPQPSKNNGSKFVMKSFVFDRATILSLKAKAKTGAGGLLVQREPSKVDVVIALIWRALIGVAKAKHGYLRPSLLGQLMNFRGKLSIIPENSCGNLYRHFSARFLGDESKMELHDLVSLIQNAKRKTVAECEKLLDGDFGPMMVINSMNEFHEEMYKEEVDVCSFSSLCGFPLYDADFGWGKPAWVSRACISSEHNVLMDTKRGDGIEAWVSLEEKNMLQFLQDPTIQCSVSLTRSLL